MKCNNYQDLMMRYFDHALSGSQQEQLDQHMNSCPACRVLMDDMRKIMETLEATPPVEPPSDMEKLVMDRIHALPQSLAYDAGNVLKGIYGSMSMAALMLTCAVTLGSNEIGFLSLMARGAAGLNSFLENVWNFQIVYNLLSDIFSETIFSMLNTLTTISVIAGCAAFIVGLEKLSLKGPMFKRIQ